MSINSCNLQGKQEVIHQKKGLILKEGIIGPEPYANTKETSVIKYIGSQSQYSTLFCLNKWAIPFVSVFTAVDFCSIIFSRFNFTSPTIKSKSNYYIHVNTIPCCLREKMDERKEKTFLPLDLPASSPNSHPKNDFVDEKPTDLKFPLSMDVFEVKSIGGITFQKYC